MSGKDAVFETEIKEIRQAVDVEIDDDFAKLFGMDELSALRDALCQASRASSTSSRSRRRKVPDQPESWRKTETRR